MTREEVINVLKKYDVYGCGVCLQDDLQNNLDAKEALDIAIELLSNDTTEKPNDIVEQKNDVVAEPTDLISRVDLMKEFAERVRESNNSDYIEPPNWNDAVSLVGSMPSVSADRPSGEWVYGTDPITGEKDYKAWTCSICGGKYPWQPSYCPNCGAKMGGNK